MTDNISRRTAIAGAVATAAVPVPCRVFAVGSTRHEIEIKSFVFHPILIQARVGDTIRWTNSDLAPHTATADEFGWDTGSLERGETGEIQVTEGMEITYFCTFHPHMQGLIEIIT